MRRRTAIITTITIIVVLVILAVISFLYFRSASQDVVTPPNTPETSQEAEQKSATEDRTDQAPPPTYPIKVYFSKRPESDNDPSKVFAVDRTAPTIAVGRYAIEQLLAGPTGGERDAGYFTTVRVRDDSSNCGGPDFTLTVKDEVATLRFCRTFDARGSVSDGQAEQSILATLRQFDTVEDVVILSKTGACQFDMSGQDLCKQQ